MVTTANECWSGDFGCVRSGVVRSWKFTKVEGLLIAVFAVVVGAGLVPIPHARETFS